MDGNVVTHNRHSNPSLVCTSNTNLRCMFATSLKSETKSNRHKVERNSYFIEESEHCHYGVYLKNYLKDNLQWKCEWNHKKDILGGKASSIIRYPQFLWLHSSRSICDYSSLPPNVILNHFDGIEVLTTKSGLVRLLTDLKYASVNSLQVCPLSFNLNEISDFRDFIDHFRLQAAVNILKFKCSSPLASLLFSERVVLIAITAVQAFLTSLHTVDIDTTETDQSSIHNYLQREYLDASHSDWECLLNESYELADYPYTYTPPISRTKSHPNSVISRRNLSTQAIRIECILSALQREDEYYLSPNNNANVYVVKASEGSKGVGIRVVHTLHAVLCLQKEHPMRIVQKYIEDPLLIAQSPSHIDTSGNSSSTSSGNSSSNPLLKFDIRVWVVVVSYCPLRAYVYEQVYGRQTKVAYTCTSASLSDVAVHLTNYSIQKQYIGGATAPTCGAVGVSGKTRRSSSKGGEDPMGELLVSHEDVVRVVNGTHASTWEDRVWPQIRSSIVCLLQASVSSVSHRHNSFELLGFDVLIDSCHHAHVLEANMTPGIAARDAAFNQRVNDMTHSLLDAVFAQASLDTSVKPSPTALASVGLWHVLIDEVCEFRATLPSRDVQYLDSAVVCVAGLAVHASRIRQIDTYFNACEKRQLLQRWARRYLFRVRLYRVKRAFCVRTLQRATLEFLPRVRMWHLKRYTCATRIQSSVRAHACRRVLLHLRRARAASCIQKHIRLFVFRRKLERFCLKFECICRNRSAMRITRFIASSNRRYKERHARVIGRCLRDWAKRRREFRRFLRAILVDKSAHLITTVMVRHAYLVARHRHASLHIPLDDTDSVLYDTDAVLYDTDSVLYDTDSVLYHTESILLCDANEETEEPRFFAPLDTHVPPTEERWWDVPPEEQQRWDVCSADDFLDCFVSKYTGPTADGGTPGGMDGTAQRGDDESDDRSHRSDDRSHRSDDRSRRSVLAPSTLLPVPSQSVQRSPDASIVGAGRAAVKGPLQTAAARKEPSAAERRVSVARPVPHMAAPVVTSTAGSVKVGKPRASQISAQKNGQKNGQKPVFAEKSVFIDYLHGIQARARTRVDRLTQTSVTRHQDYSPELQRQINALLSQQATLRVPKPRDPYDFALGGGEEHAGGSVRFSELFLRRRASMF